MSAARILADAHDAGVQLWREGERLRWRGVPPAGLIDRLREAKPELLEILGADRCRQCGGHLAWPQPVGVTFADGTAAHLGCYEEAEVARLLAAARHVVENPLAWADEAEIMLHGGPLP